MPFQPGQSGNPGGRPKESPELRAMKAKAREYTESALNVLATIMGDPDAKPSDRIAASVALLDRGHGKPSQPVGGDDDMPPIAQNLTVHLVKPSE